MGHVLLNVFDAVQAELRAQFVRDLKRSGRAPGAIAGKGGASEGLSLKDRAANSLVAEYMKFHGMEATLSVFMPESRMTKELLSREDILQTLNISDDVSAEVYNPPDSPLCLLENILGRLARVNAKRTVEFGVQTDESKDASDVLSTSCCSLASEDACLNLTIANDCSCSASGCAG